jgi:hypothetical protein
MIAAVLSHAEIAETPRARSEDMLETRGLGVIANCCKSPATGRTRMKSFSAISAHLNDLCVK